MALFPLVLVVISAVFSTIYKHFYNSKPTSSVRYMLIKAHAFATEVLQLMILGAGIVTGWGHFASKTIMLDIYIISGLDFPIPAWFKAVMTVSAYSVALFAIDLVDNRIQLGCWQHPIQTQTLLLTRASLAPWSVKKRRRRVAKKCTQKPTKKEAIRKKMVPVLTTPYQRKRTTSEPVTPEMLRRFLREIPVEVSKSGALIREARALARRASEAATIVTPTKLAGDRAAMLLRTPESMGLDRKYVVQTKVEKIERVVGEDAKDENSAVAGNLEKVAADVD